MCGIAGFSLSVNSRQNARELAHALLQQIESRGSHASGFAYVTREGKMGIYKQPKPGSQLSLAELPRNAKTVILHTRYATQGDPQDNRNNHPVISTDKRIALVHNGVISNDHSLRESLGITDAHGRVDSLVIPSLISQHGVPALNRMSGYAAIAWIDAREDGLLHVARLKNSPTAYTWLFDGSFVFASTTALLTRGLDQISANYGGVFDIGDSKMITVENGFIMDHENSPLMSYSHQTYQRYSGATSGGHGSPTTGRSSYQQPTGVAADKTGVQPGKPGPVGSEVTKSVATTDPVEAAGAKGSEDQPKSNIAGYYEDLERWRAQADARDAAVAAKALEQGPAMALGMQSELDDEEDWDEYIAQMMKTQQAIEADRQAKHQSCTVDLNSDASAEPSINKEGYYMIDSDGDISHYPTLADLEGKLSWMAKRSSHDGMIAPDAPDDIRWCNFIMDIGHLDDDGELISWVDDMAEIDSQEGSQGELQYIRDGISKVAAAIKG